MIFPTVHSNGTSRDDLFDGYVVAMQAVDAAVDALVRCAPHGRDYYPQGPDVITQAMAEHQARLKALNKVSQELTALASATR